MNKKFLNKNSRKIIAARNYTHKEFNLRGLNSYNYFNNSVSADLKKKVTVQKIGQYLKKRKIYINYNYPKKLSKYINLTTTHISNIKIFFKSFDQIAKKINLI